LAADSLGTRCVFIADVSLRWRIVDGRLVITAKETPAGANFTTDSFRTLDFANKFSADCGAGGNVN